MKTQEILKELDDLESALYSQLRSLRGTDDQESKDQGSIYNKLNNLRNTLYQAVERVMEAVEQTALMQSDPLSSINPRVEALIIEIGELRLRVKESAEIELEIEEEKNFKIELEKIDTLIDSLSFNKKEENKSYELLHYDEEAIYQALMKAITVQKESRSREKDRFLIDRSGVYDLDAGHKFKGRISKVFPQYHSVYQMYHKLYIGGGRRLNNQNIEFLSQFCYIQSCGTTHALQSLKESKCGISLTGINEFLLCMGGFQEAALSCVEQYLIEFDRWSSLAPLKKARIFPASYVQNSLKAFCFCGNSNEDIPLNSIQRIQLNRDSEWTLLPINLKIARTYSLIALPYRGNILVFGGDKFASVNMYLFSETGELIQDLSMTENIPSGMGHTSVVQRDGKIYTLGGIKGVTSKRRLIHFDGSKWRLQNDFI